MFVWKNEISITDILTCLALIIVAIGLLFTFYQMRKNSLQKRAEFMISLRNQFISNSDMVDIWYEVEYNRFHYTEALHGSTEEKKIDKLLGFFDDIARLYTMQISTKDDIKYIEYELLAIYQSQEVQKYFQFLDEHFRKKQRKIRPYDAFRAVGELLENG